MKNFPPTVLFDFRFINNGHHRAILKPDQASLLEPMEVIGKPMQPKSKQALLLLHGFGSSPAMYRNFIPHLKHYELMYCPTLPGHGTNLLNFAATPAADWIKSAEQAFQKLQNNFDKVDVLGCSLGGLLACHLTKKFKVQRLFLLAPALDMHLCLDLNIKIADILSKLDFFALRNFAGNLISTDVGELSYKQVPLRAIIEILRLIKQFDLEPPKCPTELFLGKYDAVVNSKAVAKRFSYLPKSNIHWLQESAHILPLETEATKIIECINRISQSKR